LAKFGIPHKYNNFLEYKNYVIRACSGRALPEELLKLISNEDGTGVIEILSKSITQLSNMSQQLPSHTSY